MAAPSDGSSTFPLSLLPDLSRYDPFDYWRLILFVVATVYTTTLTVQSLWGWYVYLVAPDRYTSMMRQYVILQGLRLRTKTFGGDLLVCLLLCVTFGLLWYAHEIVYDLGKTLRPR